MKTIVAALAGVVLLASPAFAASRSTEAKERDITKQLNLEQAQQAQSANQGNQQVATASRPAQSAPDAAPTTPVESAPAGNADQTQSPEASPQPASPAQ